MAPWPFIFLKPHVALPSPIISFPAANVGILGRVEIFLLEPRLFGGVYLCLQVTLAVS